MNFPSNGGCGVLKMAGDNTRNNSMDYNAATAAGDGCLHMGFDLLYATFAEQVKTNRTHQNLLQLYNTSACQFKPSLAVEMGAQNNNVAVQQGQQPAVQQVYIPGKGKGKGKQNNANVNVNNNANVNVNSNNNNNPNNNNPINNNPATINPNNPINNNPNANNIGPIPHNPQPKHQPHPGPYGKKGGGKGGK